MHGNNGSKASNLETKNNSKYKEIEYCHNTDGNWNTSQKIEAMFLQMVKASTI